MAADTPRFFNVWLVQPNTVYRGVPYSVICDWIQEGRLLGRDCVRTPGAPSWEYLDAHTLFKPYFGGNELPGANDASEALTPIEIDFGPKRREEEDDDVDMIPLIDISMVLLVFFMMTAENLITQAPFKVPPTKTSEMISHDGVVQLSIRRDPKDEKKIVYHFKGGYETNHTEQEVLDLIRDEKSKAGSQLKVVMEVEATLPFEKVQSLIMGLEKLKIQPQAKVLPKGNAAP
jgi:biopolymer transport protein ExbD